MEPLDGLVGEVIDGRYKVTSVIGSGSNSTVFNAVDLELNYPVALKVLSSSGSFDEKARERFQRGARAAALLAHPNIVRLYSFNISRQGKPYLVMDCVRGKTLALSLKAAGKLPVPHCIAIFTQVLDALEHAHGKGVVHRNLRPSNIMIIEETDLVKLVDFGIAKTFGEKETLQKLTSKGESLGSPQYMSPEQCNGQKLDGRSDIYAVGCLLFECLTGRAPFYSDNAFETMSRQVSEPPPRLSQVEPAADHVLQLESILSRALQKKPDDRYQSAGEFRHDLSLLEEVTEEEWMSRAVAARNPEDFRPRAGPSSTPDYRKPLLVASLIVATPVSALLLLAFTDLQPPGLSTLKLAMQELVLSKDDPRLLKTLAYLTDLYKRQGKFAEAWTFKEKIIKATEKPFDPDIPPSNPAGDTKSLPGHALPQASPGKIDERQ